MRQDARTADNAPILLTFARPMSGADCAPGAVVGSVAVIATECWQQNPTGWGVGLDGQTDRLHPLDSGGFDTVVTGGSPASTVGPRGGPSTDWVFHSGPHEEVLDECPPHGPRFAGVQLHIRANLTGPISSYREVNQASTSLPAALLSAPLLGAFGFWGGYPDFRSFGLRLYPLWLP